MLKFSEAKKDKKGKSFSIQKADTEKWGSKSRPIPQVDARLGKRREVWESIIFCWVCNRSLSKDKGTKIRGEVEVKKEGLGVKIKST